MLRSRRGGRKGKRMWKKNVVQSSSFESEGKEAEHPFTSREGLR